MVTMKNVSGTIVLDLLGEAVDNLTKRDYAVVTGIYGNDKESYTRLTKDITVRVDYLSENNKGGAKKDGRGSYKELEALFVENVIIVEDTETGDIFNKYYITGGMLTLEKNKDYDNNKYYRIGSLPMKAI